MISCNKLGLSRAKTFSRKPKNIYLYLKVRFCQKILMILSYLQRDEHSIFLNLKIWILVTENCLEIEDFLKFESLKACKGMKAAFGSLGQT